MARKLPETDQQIRCASRESESCPLDEPLDHPQFIAEHGRHRAAVDQPIDKCVGIGVRIQVQKQRVHKIGGDLGRRLERAADVEKRIGGQQVDEGPDVAPDELRFGNGIRGVPDDIVCGDRIIRAIDRLARLQVTVGLRQDDSSRAGFHALPEVVVEHVPGSRCPFIRHADQYQIMDLREKEVFAEKAAVGARLDVASREDSARAVGDDIHAVRPNARLGKPIVTHPLEPVAQVVEPRFKRGIDDGRHTDVFEISIRRTVRGCHWHPPVPIRRVERLRETEFRIRLKPITHIDQRLEQVVVGVVQGVDIEQVRVEAAVRQPVTQQPLLGHRGRETVDEEQRIVLPKGCLDSADSARARRETGGEIGRCQLCVLGVVQHVEAVATIDSPTDRGSIKQ